MPIGHIVATSVPAFLASLVEFVEALTIVLAVGVTRGWRSAAVGAISGVAVLALAVVAFGPLLRAIPIAVLQLLIGIMLLFFGMRWLRKAILRYAGVIALHDEGKIFARERANLSASGHRATIDAVGTLTAFNAVVLEGLEVVFIVIAVGATAGTLGYASGGAALAGVVVVGAGLLARGPLARVPENALKFVVGIMLSAFGVFWTGEGLHYTWPGDEFSLLAIVGFFAIIALLGIAIARPRTA